LSLFSDEYFYIEVKVLMTDNENNSEIARTILSIFQSWGISPADQIKLLGLPSGSRSRVLTKYRNGFPLPDNEECTMRVAYLFAIQNAVSSLFPHNAKAADYWITTQFDYFVNHTPLEIILNEGVDGMKRVLNYLNGIEDWT